MRRFVLIVLLFASCNKFLDADLDKSLVTEDRVFSSDVTATAAVTGMYNSMALNGLISGVPNSIASLTSLSSGELSNYPQDVEYQAFEIFQLSANNSHLSQLYDFLYNLIYQANAIIEGVQRSSDLSPMISRQLEGEAKFMRAFTYFNLINLFGDVPVAIQTDYLITRLLSRSPVHQVYALMENDLLEAQTLLSANYLSNERARPNRATASALLARIYLYNKKYDQAETQASSIINDNTYALDTTAQLSKTFLKDSRETIWQIMPVDPGRNTIEGNFFIITNAPPTSHVMTDNLRKSFEENDARLNWISYYKSGTDSFFFPFKYKQKNKTAADPFTEYSVVFRLSEMYLIRAEARVFLKRLSEATDDLNIIRKKARLADAYPANAETTLSAILKERQTELFTEYGHRWFDLKRAQKAISVLGNGITPQDLLYPIPAVEFKQNPNLGEQNAGYDK